MLIRRCRVPERDWERERERKKARAAAVRTTAVARCWRRSYYKKRKRNKERKKNKVKMVTGRSPRHLDPVGVKCGERALCRKERTFFSLNRRRRRATAAVAAVRSERKHLRKVRRANVLPGTFPEQSSLSRSYAVRGVFATVVAPPGTAAAVVQLD